MDMQAIRKAYSNASIIDEDKGVFDDSGNKIITEQSKIDAARTELEKLDYQWKRENEYPSMADQLDMIFHDGIEVWRDKIQSIKDKYPK